jgi:F-type H+-transporting ATPase subunit a
MSASPVDHVRDIPYFGIAKDGSIIFPKVTEYQGHMSVTWEKELMGSNWSVGSIHFTPAMFTVHGFSVLVVFLLLMLSALKAVKGISKVPTVGRGLSSQLFEVLVKFVRDDIAKPNLGPHGARYYPLILTIFFFILFSNLFGMVPTGGITQAPTGSLNVTLMLATVVFSSFFIFGIREQGLGHFIKNLVPGGLPVAMYPIMYPIELLGPVTKCVALCIRLFANMIAGHIILAAFAGLAMTKAGDLGSPISVFGAYAMSVGVSMLELFVAFLQAYVFAMLTSVFLGSFIHPDH